MSITTWIREKGGVREKREGKVWENRRKDDRVRNARGREKRFNRKAKVQMQRGELLWKITARGKRRWKNESPGRK